MNFCTKTASIWLLVGKILFVLKIIIPILIIIFGMIDLGKAVISSDDKAINKAATTLIKRIIAGVIIFFIPTIVNIAFNLISGFNEEMKNDAKNCINCLTTPYEDCNVPDDKEIFK